MGKDFVVGRRIQDGLGVRLAPNLMLSPFRPRLARKFRTWREAWVFCKWREWIGDRTGTGRGSRRD